MSITIIQELQSMYSGASFSELTEMAQIAKAELARCKQDYRDGLIAHTELLEAKHDEIAVRGLLSQYKQNGGI